MTRKFKLHPNFFSDLYKSINFPDELDLPSQTELISFAQRSQDQMEEEENELDLNNKNGFFTLESPEETINKSYDDIIPKKKKVFLSVFVFLFTFLVEKNERQQKRKNFNGYRGLYLIFGEK